MASKKMLVAASLQLFDVITKLIYVDNEHERDLPTLTKFALVQNRDALVKDVIAFKQAIENVQKELEITPESVENLTPEQNAAFEEKIKKALAEIVEHEFIQISREELEYIKDIQFTAEELSLIAATLIKKDPVETPQNS